MNLIVYNMLIITIGSVKYLFILLSRLVFTELPPPSKVASLAVRLLMAAVLLDTAASQRSMSRDNLLTILVMS